MQLPNVADMRAVVEQIVLAFAVSALLFTVLMLIGGFFTGKHDWPRPQDKPRDKRR